jgi:hypothetical protein
MDDHKPDPRVLLEDVLSLIERDVTRIKKRKKPSPDDSLTLTRYVRALVDAAESHEDEELRKKKSLKNLTTEELREKAKQILEAQSAAK